MLVNMEGGRKAGERKKERRSRILTAPVLLMVGAILIASTAMAPVNARLLHSSENVELAPANMSERWGPRCTPISTMTDQMKDENDKARVQADFCGRLSQGDPRVFGPETWKTLHRFSAFYPQAPNDAAKEGCKNFMLGLPYLIPCGHCGHHLQEFVADNDRLAGQNNDEKCRGTCTSLEQSCSNREGLVDLIRRAHDNVNANNYPCRQRWTNTMIMERYASEVETCAQGPVMGNQTICKESGQEDCASAVEAQ